MFLKYNSDRINSEDREHGAMQCQSLCERVYDHYTYWIYRLQEQTCEVWSLNIFLLPFSFKKSVEDRLYTSLMRKWTVNKMQEWPKLKKRQCWSKTAPEDYLSNCTERAWYPTPEMSEISTDKLCHAKEDSKGCSVVCLSNNRSCVYLSG